MNAVCSVPGGAHLSSPQTACRCFTVLMLWAAEAEADVDLSTTVVTSSDKGIRANIASHMLSQEECARYLETIKIYENKPADFIQERTDNDYLSRVSFGKRSFLFYHCPFDRRMSFSDFELLLF